MERSKTEIYQSFFITKKKERKENRAELTKQVPKMSKYSDRRKQKQYLK